MKSLCFLFVLLCLVSCSPVTPDMSAKPVVEFGATVREATPRAV